MPTPLYFGPYNDPGDSTGKHHWDHPHDPDCHNPALTILSTINPDRSKTLNIAVAIRNSDPVNGFPDVVVKLYAAASGLLNSVDDVTMLAGLVLNNTPTTQLPTPWPPQAIGPFSSAADNVVVLPGSVSWLVPAYASGFIVIATLESTSANQFPAPDYTQDPSTGIWLG